MSQALNFATEHLGPRAPANPKFLEDLEMTMALLLIPHDSLEPQLAALLDPGLREQAAERVNRAIIASRSKRTIAGIRDLVRMRCWAEQRSREAKMPLPEKLYLGLHGDKWSQSNDGNENGHDAMMIS